MSGSHHTNYDNGILERWSHHHRDDRLVDAGHTVLVIEHHLDVIKRADWVIDLGPGAGEEGGHVVAQGTPEQVARIATSPTGRYLTDLA